MRVRRKSGAEGKLEEFCHLLEAVHVGDGSRPSPFGRWLAENPRELRRDHRKLAEWMDTSMPMLLEARRVIDETGVECVDLLDPERPPFLVRDHRMVGETPRFQLYFACAYHTPWFTHMIGLIRVMPRPYVFAPEEVIGRLARARGWSPEAMGLREWLRRNLQDTSTSIQAWTVLNRIALVENSGLEAGELGLPDLPKESEVPDREFVPGELIERRITPQAQTFLFHPEDAPAEHPAMHSPPEVVLDEPIFSLGGLTPRQAATKPELRKELVLLVKAFIQVSDNRQALSRNHAVGV